MNLDRFVPFNEEDEGKQKKYFPAYKVPIGEVNPGGMVAPKPFAEYADRYINFEVSPTDVFVMTFPKCGTTWMQEIVWVMRNNPDGLENENSKLDPNFRVPFLEFDAIAMSSDLPPFADFKAYQNHFTEVSKNRPVNKTHTFSTLAEIAQHPRTIKIHLPFSLAPKNLEDRAKVVYVIRNVKDVCVSFYHHHRLLRFHDFQGSLTDFAEFFMKGQILYGPIWSHFRQAWEKRHHKNVYICFYEKLKKNPIEELKKLDAFLKTGLTDEQLTKVAEYTSFAQMKKRSAEADDTEGAVYINIDVAQKEGGFFYKGKANDWMNHFDEETLKRFEQWENDNLTTFDDTFQALYKDATAL